MAIMERGTIPINQNFELEYRYYDKDVHYKYFNRKFEIFLIEKKALSKNYILHMDNCDMNPGKWSPHIHKASNVKKKLYFGVSTLNWSDIKNNFLESIVGEIGDRHKESIKKAVGKLLSPKL
ncbi:MAG: hypothetical protein JSW60_02875 [Thermoplasmatales archaeon]|nr:MAG: hypothetical protein JSW60_02875 [Thermoplasmatales archaeon]